MSVVPSPPRAARRPATIIALLLLVLAAWEPLTAQRAELERRIRRDTLPNGLEVIVVENHGVPLTTIEAVVRNGSFTQSPTYEGLSHLYEHMFFKANRSYPEPDAFVARASELGAVFNAQTREELVNYCLTVPSDSSEPAVALLASALRTPLFLREELDRERSVVIGEYDRIESDPFYALNTATGKALWGGAWSRKNPLGERGCGGNVRGRRVLGRAQSAGLALPAKARGQRAVAVADRELLHAQQRRP